MAVMALPGLGGSASSFAVAGGLRGRPSGRSPMAAPGSRVRRGHVCPPAGGEYAVFPESRVFCVGEWRARAGKLGTPARPGVGPESRGGPSDGRLVGRP